MKRFIPADVDSLDRHYLDLLAKGNIDSARALVAPELLTEDARAQLTAISRVLNGRSFDSARVIGSQVNSFGDIRRASLTYELHSSAGWLVANVVTVESNGSRLVEGVSAMPLAQSLEEQNRFSLAKKQVRHYVWLFLAIVCGFTSIATAIFVATRRGMPRRWIWTLVAALGVGAFSLNWTSGEIFVRPAYVQLLSAGFVRAGPAAPWIVVFALPLGALWSLLRYRAWRRQLSSASSNMKSLESVLLKVVKPE